MDTTIKQYGKLDVLVNNAGNLGHGSIKDDHVLEEFDRDFDLLIRPVVELIHLSIPHHEKSKGTIINISSIGSLAPVLYKFRANYINFNFCCITFPKFSIEILLLSSMKIIFT